LLNKLESSLSFEKLNVEIRTGVEEEKKSISFPMVKGMLIDTEDETKSNPIAIPSGFRSGFAKPTIFRSEEVVSGARKTDSGRIRERKVEGFGGD
jgi:hypothetical protein